MKIWSEQYPYRLNNWIDMMKHITLLPAILILAISLLIGCADYTPVSETGEASTPLATANEPAAGSASFSPEAQTAPAANTAEAGSQRSEAAIVQEDTRNMLKAVYQADIDTVLGYTHPKIIAMMGGLPKTKAVLEVAFEKLKSVNMKLESFEFPGPPIFLEGEVNRFVIVPTKSLISMNGKRVESLNYQFGIQKKSGATWKYVEGSRINKNSVRVFFPDFPEGFVFPETYRKNL